MSQESDGSLYFGRTHTRLEIADFQLFRMIFTSSQLVEESSEKSKPLPIRSHQAEIVVKRLIQGRNNVTKVGIEQQHAIMNTTDVKTAVKQHLSHAASRPRKWWQYLS